VLAGNCDVTARNAACCGAHFILYSLLKPVKMRHGRVAVRLLSMGVKHPLTTVATVIKLARGFFVNNDRDFLQKTLPYFMTKGLIPRVTKVEFYVLATIM
jgi:hypothetical protein